MRVIAAFTLCVGLIVGACSASAQTIATSSQLTSYQVGVWKAGAFTAAGSTAFGFCGGKATYNSGVTVAFILTNTFHWGIVLYDPAWNLTVNSTYPIALAVDARGLGGDTATAISSNEVLIPLNPTVALFKTFMEGEKLRIEVAAGTYTFDLTNTAEMLPSLLKCVQGYAGAAPASANPFTN